MMLGYAIMLAMKREYGFRTFLDTNVLLNLKQYFKSISDVNGSESLCFTEYPWTDYMSTPQLLSQDKQLSTGHAIRYVDDVSRNLCYILIFILMMNRKLKFIYP